MTPRMSVRARAREIYGEMAPASLRYAGQAPSSLGFGGQGEAGASSSLAAGSVVEGSAPRESAAAPTPDPSPLLARASGGGEKKARAGEDQEATGVGEGQPPSLAQPDLTAKVRELYEKSAVPVREIARLVGVTERMIYRYVEKGGWKRRYNCVARDEAVAAANRGRRWQVSPERQGDVGTDVTPAKGSGGRFIRREDIGKPYPTGLKALDPNGRAAGLAASAKATTLSRAAQARARREERFNAFLACLSTNAERLSDLRKHRESYPKERKRSALDLRIETMLLSLVEHALRPIERHLFGSEDAAAAVARLRTKAALDRQAPRPVMSPPEPTASVPREADFLVPLPKGLLNPDFSPDDYRAYLPPPRH